MGTKNNPGNFDCYHKAEPDEPMFVLLGRDPVAAEVVRFWVKLRESMGATSTKLSEALACADEMDRWAKLKGREDEVLEARRRAELLLSSFS